MNRQREGLKQSVEAEGHTDSFSMLKLKDGIDLRSSGCHGPAEKVEKPTQAVHCLNGFCFNFHQKHTVLQARGRAFHQLLPLQSCKAHQVEMHMKELLQVNNKCCQSSEKLSKSVVSGADRTGNLLPGGS